MCRTNISYNTFSIPRFNCTLSTICNSILLSNFFSCLPRLRSAIVSVSLYNGNSKSVARNFFFFFGFLRLLLVDLLVFLPICPHLCVFFLPAPASSSALLGRLLVSASVSLSDPCLITVALSDIVPLYYHLFHLVQMMLILINFFFELFSSFFFFDSFLE